MVALTNGMRRGEILGLRGLHQARQSPYNFARNKNNTMRAIPYQWHPLYSGLFGNPKPSFSQSLSSSIFPLFQLAPLAKNPVTPVICSTRNPWQSSTGPMEWSSSSGLWEGSSQLMPFLSSRPLLISCMAPVLFTPSAHNHLPLPEIFSSLYMNFSPDHPKRIVGVNGYLSPSVL
jgi:hypothetical protein